ncbi:MAG: RIO1 family regulatory kinase/ATPase [Anaerolineales bacterium]
MSKNQLHDYFDELDDMNENTQDSARKRTSIKRESKRKEGEAKLFIRAQEAAKEFKFTYKAARFEEAWLLDSLTEIYEHQWISDVLRKVKGGKEASVYLCKSGTEMNVPFVAAKIYRPRSLRNLKNDAQYRVGRVDLDADGSALWKEADVNAIAKRTTYGEEVRHRSWIAYEFKTMEKLFEAGVDVPKPYAMEKNAIVMDFVGDESSAAPILNSVNLSAHEAKNLFDRVIHNIDLMLANDCIHGDLSAYNILYWNGAITLIDFPQIVLPKSNPTAWNIFQRDVIRICDYFSAQGIHCDGRKIAAELWTSRGYRIGKQADPKYLDPEDLADRKLWDKQQ